MSSLGPGLDDVGVWAIWKGGPIKAGHDLAHARWARAMAKQRMQDPDVDRQRTEHLHAYNAERAEIQGRYRMALHAPYGTSAWRAAWDALHVEIAALDARYWPDRAQVTP